eukprot:5745755-Prymnesium_polylepis.2
MSKCALSAVRSATCVVAARESEAIDSDEQMMLREPWSPLEPSLKLSPRTIARSEGRARPGGVRAEDIPYSCSRQGWQVVHPCHVRMLYEPFTQEQWKSPKCAPRAR